MLYVNIISHRIYKDNKDIYDNILKRKSVQLINREKIFKRLIIFFITYFFILNIVILFINDNNKQQ